MHAPVPLRAVLFALAMSSCAGAALAQAAPAPSAYEPSVGQEGKDVVWVPTPQALVDKMLDMAKVTPADYLIDLGSGDGRTVITAAKRGVRALGIEYNPDMIELSKRNAEQQRVGDKATFVKILGPDGARDEARALVDRAKARLSRFGDRAEALKGAADFVFMRRN